MDEQGETAMSAILSQQDRNLVLEFIEACHTEEAEPLSADVVYTRLHALLPHEIFATARMHTLGGDIFQFNGPGFPKEYLDLSRSGDGTFRCPMLSRWVRAQRPLYYDQRYRKRITRLPERAAAFADLGLRNIAVHGVLDSSRNTATCYGFARIGAKWSERTITLIRLITPHLHVALVQRHLPSLPGDPPETQPVRRLTQREEQVLHWLSYGKTTADIGLILGIAQNTVHIHTQNIVRKLEASNRVHAVAKALRSGIIGM